MINWLSKFKAVTHVAAVGFGLVVAFATSDAGQALIKQYPKLSGVAALILALGALYHSPKQ